ncbi:hypothetical protein KAK07_01845 [Ideonella sp. 4Y16]|uniref:Lipoprotein n=1 Tax=Ideonella alba TaxID=2824118 RepID=A0A941BK73_9BURK|nr:hypothetical protein [Ideonella alba]MBQ0929839.1 hypothetical protein [Ideonella alba]MBQ0942070.1 hypothetical protein [Ideonella alba]
MNLFRRPSLPLLALFWSSVLGSAAVHAYEPPAGAPTAQIRLTAARAFNTNMIIGHAPECRPTKVYRFALLGVANLFGGHPTLDMPLKPAVPPAQIYEATVEADRTLVVLATASSSLLPVAGLLDKCKVETHFHARAGGRYEANYTIENNDRCTLQISELLPDSEGGWRRAEVATLPKPPAACDAAPEPPR